MKKQSVGRRVPRPRSDHDLQLGRRADVGRPTNHVLEFPDTL